MLTSAAFDRTRAARQALIQQLPLLRRRSSQAEFLKQYPELWTAETVVWLSDSLRDQAKIDTANAPPLAELATVIASKLKDKTAQAYGLRAMANSFHLSGQNRKAANYHEKAWRMFASVGDRNEVARTLSASIQPLILIGRYGRALANAGKARKIFRALKDDWRLARLNLNTGNIFHRRDRFSEAIKWYQRAYRYFLVDVERDPEATGVALHNIAMCYVSLNNFHGAFAAHQEARQFAEAHGMRVLVAQSDYNIAALHYLRGEHSRALRILLEALDLCQKAGDQYHVGLCHLDLSEIYLQLNLAGPAEEMAEAASADFQQLRMGYEVGKSLVNLALAMARQDKSTQALKMLVRARRQFVAEKNSALPFLTDFYRALILTRNGRHRQAEKLCRVANRFFRSADMPEKLILTQLLLAQLQLLSGELPAAKRSCSQAIELLDNVELPLLACKAKQLMGRIYTESGKRVEAYACYEKASRLLEAIRDNLQVEELSISFTQDNLEIYEGLIQLCLDTNSPYYDLEAAWKHVEQSKSRALQDMVSRAEIDEPSVDRTDRDQREASMLRSEINFYSRRLAQEQLRVSAGPAKAFDDLQMAIQQREKKLLRLERESNLSSANRASLLSSKPLSLEELRAILPADATLLEYFQIHDELFAAVATHNTLDIVPVATASKIVPLVEHLEFQLAKFRLGAAYLAAFRDSLLQTTQHHLAELYDAVFSSVRKRLKGQHLIVVPHGVLHRLPFQALFDGKEYLVDKFTISYAPSAAVYGACTRRPVNVSGPALVLGVPDAAAPLIGDEAGRVAEIVPDAKLLLGDEATTSALWQLGPKARLIHIATHGYYRRDSPMFSGVKLSDSMLSLYDLYRYKLPAELITLSGCATGVSTVAGGDELLGLVRGLIYAGARAALLTLWDVHDRSTVEFMTSFYQHVVAGDRKATALQKAAWAVRKQYPHPYYWAPFTLVGNTLS